MTPKPPKTPSQVRAEFIAAGISLRAWCREHGFSYSTALDLMNDRQQGLRGQAHQVAVALGLKVGQIVSPKAFKAPPRALKGARR